MKKKVDLRNKSGRKSQRLKAFLLRIKSKFTLELSRGNYSSLERYYKSRYFLMKWIKAISFYQLGW